MNDTTLTKADLEQFTGTENWYRHALVRGILFTNGTKFLADRAGTYWPLDEIAFSQRRKKVVAESFQCWRLKVEANRSAHLTCGDGNGNIVFRKNLDYTDFPLDEISLYCADKTILLPSEY